MFGKVKQVILEVEKDTKLPELTGELREMLKTLPHNPAFQYLLSKMRLERASLQKYLQDGFQLTESQLHHLQAGVHYLGWIESEIARHTKVAETRTRELAQHEEDLLKNLTSHIDFIS